MRIIGLNGSPRRSQSRTGQLVEQALNGAMDAGAEIEYLDIANFEIKPCIACDKCHKTGYCVQKDDFQGIYDKIAAADGLVLASPVYIYQVTAQLKSLIDRLGNAIHCLRFQGKYGAVITTAGGSGEIETADYMEKVLRRTGMQSVGRLARCIDNEGLIETSSPLIDEAKNLGRSLVQSIKEEMIFPNQIDEQEQIKGYFQHVILKHVQKWSWEYEYWKEKGWL